MRLVEPLTLSMLGSVEMYLLHSMPEMTDIVLRDFDAMDEQASELLLYAVREDERRLHFVPGGQLNDFLETPEGLVLTLWLATRETSPDLSFGDLEAHLDACDATDRRRLSRSVKLVSCLDERAEKDWLRIPTGPDDQGRMNWKHLVRKLCEAYFGVTPQDVGRMTLYQVRMMSVGEGDVRGMKVTVGEFRRLQREGKLEDVGIRWVPKKKRKGA